MAPRKSASPPDRLLSHRGAYPPFGISRSDWMDAFPAHRHDFLELTYIFEGKGRGLSDGREHVFAARDLLITRPGVEHAFLAEKGKRHRQISLAVYPELLAKWGSPHGLAAYHGLEKAAPTQATLAPDSARDAERSIENLFRENIFRLNGFERVLALELERLLILLSRNLEGGPAGLERLRDLPPSVHEALERIESSFYDIGGLEDLVSDPGVSARHLIALFKRHLGLTPIQYLIRVRIEKCCGLLASEGLSITDAAHQCGFNDLGHFNTQFKSLTALTPREYRRRLLAGAVKPDSFSRFRFPRGREGRR